MFNKVLLISFACIIKVWKKSFILDETLLFRYVIGSMVRAFIFVYDSLTLNHFECLVRLVKVF